MGAFDGATQFFAEILERANDELAIVQPSLRDSKDFCLVPGNKLPGYFRNCSAELFIDLSFQFPLAPARFVVKVSFRFHPPVAAVFVF